MTAPTPAQAGQGAEAAPDAPARGGFRPVNLLLTLAGCVALVWVGAPPFGAFAAGFFGLYLVPRFIYIAALSLKRPAERRQRLAQVALWLTAIAIVAIAQQYHAHAARQAAEAVLMQARDYRVRKGVWPKKPEDMGLDPAALKRGYRVLYAAVNNDPFLMYPSTWNGFDKYYYDFRQQTWAFHPD